jgi:hypothetical protein
MGLPVEQIGIAMLVNNREQSCSNIGENAEFPLKGVSSGFPTFQAKKEGRS